jgi:hypothetical protein
VEANVGNDPCNQCAEASCCTQLEACANDLAGSDGATSECISLFDCVSAYLTADSGDASLADALDTCGAGHPAAAQTEASNFLTCLQDSCATSCSQ